MDLWYLVAAVLGFVVGVAAVVIFLFRKVARIDVNVRSSEKLLDDCSKEKIEIDRVKYGLHHSQLLRTSKINHVTDWNAERFKNLRDIPKGMIIIARSDDVRTFCEHQQA